MKIIECGTCKYNAKGCYDSVRCLTPTTGIQYKIIKGEKMETLYWYHYHLWEPKGLLNYLPEELFNI